MNLFHNVFFDLDGTLSDPKEGITNSYLYALNKLGFIETEKEDIPYYFGAPLHEYFTKKHHLKDSELESAIKLYREYYSQKGLYENIIYNGIPELLNALQLNGRTIYLVTVKPAKFAKIILKYFNIEKYFCDVYGSDLSGFNQTKEYLIKTLLENEKIDSDQCVMVGDRKHDIIGAKLNQVSSIAVTYGYGGINELKECNPDHIINSVNELSDHLL